MVEIPKTVSKIAPSLALIGLELVPLGRFCLGSEIVRVLGISNNLVEPDFPDSMVFCLEHRVQESHSCPKAGQNSRKVVVCEVCSTSIEITGQVGHDEKEILMQHTKSGKCDPKLKKKATCGVKRCKEFLTYSNSSTCKICEMKVCLKHRFPGDHVCAVAKAKSVATVGINSVRTNDKFLMALAQRNAKDCGKSQSGRAARASPPSTPRSTKAY
ncbi:unnamed protein product [Rhodiola kirilowii]